MCFWRFEGLDFYMKENRWPDIELLAEVWSIDYTPKSKDDSAIGTKDLTTYTKGG